MGGIQKQADYLGDARRKLLEQFKNLPRVDGFLQAVMAEVQELEDAGFDVYVSRLIDNDPVGDLEDKLGALVGQPRNGFSDDQYRIFITARIAANRSDGKHETLISITSLLINQQVPILFRTYLKALEIEVYDVPVNPYIIWHDFLNIAKAAGDSLRFFFTVNPITDTLIRESVSGGVTTTTTQRKGSVSGTCGGGFLAGVFG